MNQSRSTSLLQQGMAAHRKGELGRAVRCYEAALQVNPREVDALHLLGVAVAASGDCAKGIGYIENVVRLQPSFPAAWFNLGNLFQRMGKTAEAIGALQKALTLQPKNPDVLCNLGNCLTFAGRLQEALEVFRKAEAVDPRNPVLQSNLGLVLSKMGRLEESVEAFRRAVGLKPDFAEAVESLGMALHTLGRPSEALDVFRKALALNPGNAVVWSEYGDCLALTGDRNAAGQAYDRAIALAPRLVAAYIGKGNVLQKENCLDEAMALYQAACAIDPRCAEALCNVGTIHLARGDLVAAEAGFRNALAANPDYRLANWNLAVTLLSAGRYAEGWPAYEDRWCNPGMAKARRVLPGPLWLGGEPIEGRRILVHAEQGFGDTLQFVRYIPLLAARGATVHLQVQAPLLRLLRSTPGAATVGSLADPLPGYDCHCPLLSLPLAFGTTLENIPAGGGYLTAPEGLRAAWEARLSGLKGLKVGIVWAGNKEHGNDSNRSIPLKDMAALLEAPGCSFVSLQKEVRPQEEALFGELSRQGSILDLREGLADFADTAALVSCLDLVITIDSAVVHLAGALGRRTWLLVPANTDWRWLRDRSDSPWYSSVRIFRQKVLGDWSGVLKEICGQCGAGISPTGD